MLAKRKALRRTESFELFLSFEKGSLTAGTVFDDVPWETAVSLAAEQ